MTDILIIGAGIVGLTVADTLLARNPALSITILEKEPEVARHASGRNSGVMHCGIFYGADTLKAKVCAKGAARMTAFAAEHGIAMERSGKLVLATREDELPAIEKLLGNARDNGIRAERVTPEEAAKIEPFAAPATGAIFCPDTAVIDSKTVVYTLQKQLAARGVKFVFDCTARGRLAPQLLDTTQGAFAYGFLFNCAGAYADTVARMFDCAQHHALVPFKGIYWKLNADAAPRVRANIYPVPDPALPFLGIHLTRVISGDVYLGPTAIPAFGRENYGILSGIRGREAARIIPTLARMYWANQQNFRRLTHQEIRKYHKPSFYRAAQRLMPSLSIHDMVPTRKAGIRPQLVNLNTWRLEMDYIMESGDHSLHVLNTISPAFTSSFAFAEMIVERSGLDF